MRTIGVVTVARSDYGLYLPILDAISEDAEMCLRLFVSGMHLSPEFGSTVKMIEEDGFEIAERVEMLLSSDTPEGVAKSIGLGVVGFSYAFTRTRPDILVVLGDRFEMYAAAMAAVPLRIPIAHIHGGEVTQGAMDDALRHSLTKLSHLHFVSTPDYGRRVEQLGEESWRITVTGAPSVDNFLSMKLITREELESFYNICLTPSPLLVTFHPVTLDPTNTEWQIDELLAALNSYGSSVVFTQPNADMKNAVIRQKIDAYTKTRENAWSLDNMGTQRYFSMMREASAMVGNSSSGIVEAALLKLPVVNIGTRQKGRIKTKNIIDVGHRTAEILDGIKIATSESFKKGLEGLRCPYGDGHSASRILSVLKKVSLDPEFIIKKFIDHPWDKSIASQEEPLP